MRQTMSCLTIISMVATMGSIAFAAPVQWEGNGHWYEVVVIPQPGVSWPEAEAAAEAKGGYLATITSAEENQFVYDLTVNTPGAWAYSAEWAIGPCLGGYQDLSAPDYGEPSGGWRWVTGEPWQYTNWLVGQPDNWLNMEHRLIFWSYYTPGPTWNDFAGDSGIINYVIEYDSEPGANTAPVAVCQDVVIAVGADGYVDASLDGGSYDPDGDAISLSQDPPGPYPAGVYIVTLTVTDSHGASDSCQAMLVVYDPSGGFVTGGGWVWSPQGAYSADPWLEGKASFGFVSKYRKGATVPTGQTEFVFQAGDLNFHSSSYQWLVVNQDGSNAQFKGSGTINGAGNYEFMLWAGDDAPDTFRIKIWTEDDAGVETDVYDNGFDGSGYETGQPMGGGSIIVHTN